MKRKRRVCFSQHEPCFRTFEECAYCNRTYYDGEWIFRMITCGSKDCYQRVCKSTCTFKDDSTGTLQCLACQPDPSFLKLSEINDLSNFFDLICNEDAPVVYSSSESSEEEDVPWQIKANTSYNSTQFSETCVKTNLRLINNLCKIGMSVSHDGSVSLVVRPIRHWKLRGFGSLNCNYTTMFPGYISVKKS